MKNFSLKPALLLAVAGLYASSAAFAAPRENRYRMDGNRGGGAEDIGVGLMVGSQAGVTGKIWTNDVNAIALGIGFANTRSTTLSADYLWHWGGTRTVAPYLGAGLIVGFGGRNFLNNDNTSGELGVRIPIGLEILPQGVPLGFFAELDPGIGIAPGGYTFLEANVGGRYYF